MVGYFLCHYIEFYNIGLTPLLELTKDGNDTFTSRKFDLSQNRIDFLQDLFQNQT